MIADVIQGGEILSAEGTDFAVVVMVSKDGTEAALAGELLLNKLAGTDCRATLRALGEAWVRLVEYEALAKDGNEPEGLPAAALAFTEALRAARRAGGSVERHEGYGLSPLRKR